MQNLEWFTVDKSSWNDGPWQHEPDKKQWTDEATKLPCLIVRNHMGALCGYVGLSVTHPCHGKVYWDVDVDVHGGLTYSEPCQLTDDPSHGVCHMVEPGEEDGVWWFGFDCAHAGDMIPTMSKYFEFGYGFIHQYRDLSYVERECANLAKQLAALA